MPNCILAASFRASQYGCSVDRVGGLLKSLLGVLGCETRDVLSSESPQKAGFFFFFLILQFISHPLWSGKGRFASLEPRTDCRTPVSLRSHSLYKPVSSTRSAGLGMGHCRGRQGVLSREQEEE